MREVLEPGAPPGSILGYCTNVHAGDDWTQTRANLQRFAARIKSIVSPDRSMGIGLWLSARTARELLAEARVQELRELLDEIGLTAFTFNGFPFGDFHQEVVKHAVYSPDWSQAQRLAYTTNLATILSQILPVEDVGSISTLPIGWHQQFTDESSQQAAAANLRAAAHQLHRIEQTTGRSIHLDLEPEPFCALELSDDLVTFFKRWLLAGKDEAIVRRHLRVCHDICHAAVMFEDQAEMFNRYRDAGIEIGKVQISNAIRCDLRQLSARERVEALAQLRNCVESRYLHQTTIADDDTGMCRYEDLPHALAESEATDRAGDEWRVHFHVPVYLEEFGLLKTTRDCIIECLRLLRGSEVKHWEVETYAWNVLPKDLKVPDLAQEIAREMMWVIEQAKSLS